MSLRKIYFGIAYPIDAATILRCWERALFRLKRIQN